MALRIVELFGYSPLDSSAKAASARENCHCPFLDHQCTKHLSDGTISGACTVRLAKSGSIICCPNRLYSESYGVLSDVAVAAFGPDIHLISAAELGRTRPKAPMAVVFGKRWGKELRLPQRGGRGGYFVDWILARTTASGKLDEFVAVEVQAIDTTGNYRAERSAYMRGKEFGGNSVAGLNWENVSKRILPQLIYKGHVLRQEALCKKGMFFICPTPVYERIRERLGGEMRPYHFQPGSLTFSWYDLGSETGPGRRRELLHQGNFTTTIDQVALAFTAPANLPPAGVYRKAIEAELAAEDY